MAHPITPTKNLRIIVNSTENKSELLTYKNEYRSLMHLIADQLFLEDFGSCSGMGKCGTCIVEIISGGYDLNSFDRNEEKTLKNCERTAKKMRLSCQIMLDEFANSLEINLI